MSPYLMGYHDMRPQLFFVFIEEAARIFLVKKKLCTHIFLSLERVFSSSLSKKLQNDIKQRFLCALGVISKHSPNSLQTHMFSLFLIIFVYFAFVFSEKEE